VRPEPVPGEDAKLGEASNTRAQTMQATFFKRISSKEAADIVRGAAALF
jgi:hypothetical protein